MPLNGIDDDAHRRKLKFVKDTDLSGAIFADMSLDQDI